LENRNRLVGFCLFEEGEKADFGNVFIGGGHFIIDYVWSSIKSEVLMIINWRDKLVGYYASKITAIE
jgi:hypothetical protein